MKYILKTLFIPKEETIEIKAIKSWTVSWINRHGSFSWETETEYETFLSKEDAKAFKKQLKAAFNLLRHTSGTNVNITEN